MPAPPVSMEEENVAKIEHAEALRRIGDLLAAGYQPGLVVSFRMEAGGAVHVDIHAGGGIVDAPMVEAALEMALVGNATAELVAGKVPPVGGWVKGLTEHSTRGVVGR